MRCGIKFLQVLFPTVLFSMTDSKIHLTFDDGPHPHATPQILDILHSRNIKATFFLLGHHVHQYPDIARHIIAEGHQIGNHSFLHENLFFKNSDYIHNALTRTENIFQSILGKRSSYFRPPYGYFNHRILHVARNIGMTCVLWNVNSKDFQVQNPQSIKQRVIERISNGSILLFHDNNHTENRIGDYLPGLLDALLNKGFDFSELPS